MSAKSSNFLNTFSVDRLSFSIYQKLKGKISSYFFLIRTNHVLLLENFAANRESALPDAVGMSPGGGFGGGGFGGDGFGGGAGGGGAVAASGNDGDHGTSIDVMTWWRLDLGSLFMVKEALAYVGNAPGSEYLTHNSYILLLTYCSNFDR